MEFHFSDPGCGPPYEPRLTGAEQQNQQPCVSLLNSNTILLWNLLFGPRPRSPTRALADGSRKAKPAPLCVIIEFHYISLMEFHFSDPGRGPPYEPRLTGADQQNQQPCVSLLNSNTILLWNFTFRTPAAVPRTSPG